MLTKTVKTTKQVPVNVLNLKWKKPPSGKELRKLPCSACGKAIGDKKWGLAWCEDKKVKYTMRLCESCGKKAAQALKTKDEKPDRGHISCPDNPDW